METINAAVEQLEANFRTLRKESSSRRPIRKRPLQQKDSLMRKFHQKKLMLTGPETCLPTAFEVQVLRSENIDSHSPHQSPTAKSPRIIKLPKWPESCSGSPSFMYSPRKLLELMSPSSPNSSPVREVAYYFSVLPFYTSIFLVFILPLGSSSIQFLLSANPNRFHV